MLTPLDRRRHSQAPCGYNGGPSRGTGTTDSRCNKSRDSVTQFSDLHGMGIQLRRRGESDTRADAADFCPVKSRAPLAAPRSAPHPAPIDLRGGNLARIWYAYRPDGRNQPSLRETSLILADGALRAPPPPRHDIGPHQARRSCKYYSASRHAEKERPPDRTTAPASLPSSFGPVPGSALPLSARMTPRTAPRRTGSLTQFSLIIDSSLGF